MKTYKHKKVTEVIEEVDTVICNCCGKTEKDPNYQTITDISISFGYGSSHDGDRWFMDLCDECLENITDSFKYPIKIKEMF